MHNVAHMDWCAEPAYERTRDPRLTRGVVEHRAHGPKVIPIKEDERPRDVQRKVLGLVAAAHDG